MSAIRGSAERFKMAECKISAVAKSSLFVGSLGRFGIDVKQLLRPDLLDG